MNIARVLRRTALVRGVAVGLFAEHERAPFILGRPEVCSASEAHDAWEAALHDADTVIVDAWRAHEAQRIMDEAVDRTISALANLDPNDVVNWLNEGTTQRTRCATCGAVGFAPSTTGVGCAFCDGTEGGARNEIEGGPHTCRYCGAASWIDPSDQTPPADYCHPGDHGSREEHS